jgi:hypothetical protein
MGMFIIGLLAAGWHTVRSGARGREWVALL